MTNNDKTTSTQAAVSQLRQKAGQKPLLLRLPGLVAISAYMIVVAGFTTVLAVQHGVHPFLLIFPVLFIAGALGLLKLLRWAWALTLAAVALMAGSCLWVYSTEHLSRFLLQGLLNLVFFLYLVRTDVRESLK
jgi:hypothetical protein